MSVVRPALAYAAAVFAAGFVIGALRVILLAPRVGETAQAVKSAQRLLNAGDPDGACNRAYYAMFDAARAALIAAGQDIGKTHRGVLNAFSERLVKDGANP